MTQPGTIEIVTDLGKQPGEVRTDVQLVRVHLGRGFWVDVEVHVRAGEYGVDIRTNRVMEMQPVAGNVIRVGPRRDDPAAPTAKSAAEVWGAHGG